MGWRLVDAQQHLASDHHTRYLRLIRLTGDQFARVFAAPQHGYRIGEFQHLAQLMADENDGLALRDQAAQDSEEFKGFLWRQYARWLVHNQDISAAIEHFQNLDALLQADGELLDTHIRSKGQTISLAQSAN